MDVEFWKFVNSFAPWLSAIGSLSAVFLALYLSRQDKRVRLDVSVGHRLIITPGEPGPHPECLAIKIVNVGHREAQISNLTWKTGIFKKSYAVQMTTRDLLSSPMPHRIKDGEEANYFIELDRNNDWINKFIKDFLPNFPSLRLWFIRFRVHTSIGKNFSTKLESSLKKLCLDKWSKVP
ncbi:hypothetical protein CRYPA_1465 [uncultured Candidatus Thioglobus sp.]|nr:hypothetical protein CRYPA_1465 [uncultured Candidatus Thioglobus sp.]